VAGRVQREDKIPANKKYNKKEKRRETRSSNDVCIRGEACMFHCCLSAVVLYWILMMSFTFACQAEKETDGWDGYSGP
jgi:hypothetical protein